jgi:hypothetical protein
MADVDGVLQVEFFGEGCEIVRVGIHLVTIPRLGETAVPSPVMRDDSIALLAALDEEVVHDHSEQTHPSAVAIHSPGRSETDVCAGLPGPSAPGTNTKAKIKALMHRLFEKAMFWELMPVGRNPMALVEIQGASRRRKKPIILTVERYFAVLGLLPEPYRTMVVVALCLGLTEPTSP